MHKKQFHHIQPRKDFCRRGFTPIELLVVIAVMAILASMWLPALARSKSTEQAIKCLNNNRQISLAFIMYAGDNKDFLPPLATGSFPASPPNIWYWQYLANGNYIASISTNANNVWRCPAVQDQDIQPGTADFYGTPMEGYGPMEGNTAAQSIFRFGVNGGSRTLSSLRRPSQLWMIGDVGVPKLAAEQTHNVFPTGGYYTEFSTRQPVPGLGPAQGWVTAPAPPKQAACRHNRRAVFAFCDGHTDAWKWEDLVQDVNDVFAIRSF